MITPVPRQGHRQNAVPLQTSGIPCYSHFAEWRRACTDHADGLGVDGLGERVGVARHVVQHLVEAGSLDFLKLQVAERVAGKVEKDAALTQLLHKKLFAIRRRRRV